MPLAHVDLLLQSLRECCDDLQQRHNDSARLLDHANFATSRLWIKGIASGLEETSTDLKRWCDRFERKKHVYEEQCYWREINKTVELCDWIKEVSGNIVQLIEDGSQPELTRGKSRDTLGEIEQNIEWINRRISTVKQLDQLDAKANNNVIQIVRQSQLQVESIKVIFEERLKNLLPSQRDGSFCILGERGCLEFERMDWFWSKIPRPPGMSRTRDKSDRCDGVLISVAHVDKARAALLMFIEAWLTVVGNPVDRPSLDAMQHMPAIACVLYAAGKHAQFNKFIAAEIKDSALKEGHDVFLAKVEDALKSESQAKEIVAQFSRIQARPWPNGTNLVLEWSEPVPLREIAKLRESNGPVGVYEVEDVWEPKQRYAVKVVKTETAVHAQLAHLKNEINKLTTIGQENHKHHIVKCVKTYERGGQSSEIGMLLLPVAACDLNKFLNECCQKHEFRRRYRKDLIQACGCLSYSLAYLHNVLVMRHRDVKPHNILVHQETDKCPPEFLWADFGLAFVFREQGFSGDRNPNFGATPEYEAPEIDPECEGQHTRAADVFALGLVFLEIVWILTMPERCEMDQIGLRHDYWVNSRREFYKHHLVGLNAWIKKTDAKLKTSGNKTLRLILQLAEEMIRKEHNLRPKIGEVVRRLWSSKKIDANEKPFCPRCIEKLKVDTSKRPLHFTIFQHQVGRRDSMASTVGKPLPFTFSR